MSRFNPFKEVIETDFLSCTLIERCKITYRVIAGVNLIDMFNTLMGTLPDHFGLFDYATLFIGTLISRLPLVIGKKLFDGREDSGTTSTMKNILILIPFFPIVFALGAVMSALHILRVTLSFAVLLASLPAIITTQLICDGINRYRFRRLPPPAAAFDESQLVSAHIDALLPNSPAPNQAQVQPDDRLNPYNIPEFQAKKFDADQFCKKAPVVAGPTYQEATAQQLAAFKLKADSVIDYLQAAAPIPYDASPNVPK